jgi:hypothetical protein
MGKVYQNVIAPGDLAALLLAVNETVKLFFSHYPEQKPENSMIFIPKYMIGFLVRGINETQLSPPSTHFDESLRNGASFYFGLPIFFNHEDSIVVMAEDALSYPEDSQPIIKLYYDDRTRDTV